MPRIFGEPKITKDSKGDYFEKAVKVREAIKELIDIKEDKSDDIDYKEYELKSKLQVLDELRNDIGKKLVKAIAYMYEGTLIDNYISVRKDGVYRFRCQWKPEPSAILEDLYRHKDEVLKKVKDAKPLLEVIDKLYPNNNLLQSRNLFNQKNMIMIPTTPVLDITGRGYRDETDKYSMVDVNVIFYYDDGTFNFAEARKKDDGEYDEYNATRICDEGVVAKLTKKFINVIKERRAFMLNLISDEKNRLNDAKNLVENNLGKYILLNELKSEAITEAFK